MRLVMKFGGTSVGDADCIAKVVDLIKKSREEGNEIAVVVSAMTKVTDQIITEAEGIVSCTDKKNLDTFIDNLRDRHLTALRIVAPDYVEDVTAHINIRLERLRNILIAVNHLRELTPRSRDYIISFGEKLSAPIVSAALRQAGIPSFQISGCDAGILTDGVHGGATALPESYPRIMERIGVKLGAQVPVIQGFAGCSGEGAVTTLGRSGSDYSGAIIGAGIDAEEIIIWTDVDGVMTTDPRMIPEARVIDSLSFLEMMEMSYFGAKVIHPRALLPAMEKNIPVYVKNTFNPTHPGTVVIKESHADKRIVKAVSLIKNSSMISISGFATGKPGVAGEIFTSLAQAGVNVMLISQGSSEMNISLIITEEQVSAANKALIMIKERGLIREYTFSKDVNVVSVVGAGMAGTPGTLYRIFHGLGLAKINVMMISQGSEVNVSFVVKEEDGVRAVRAIHEEYDLDKEEA
ncbi:aspartate kinase [Methanocorpusculum labreanum Z]|uniref:Aspartokinase n=1 Tax=Methanocorpusculum labreanum (strain ATCC 43576 / DSM 4855 / Z) TaxID=410358 RepID=A2SPR3_METLZ|nr:aspartate kinase [Methanocorpusculum labreanum]ABN06319.1 aspartate kinase [Methanocorpusculum labreanum Z]